MSRVFPPPLALHQLANQLVFLAVGKLVFQLPVTWLEFAGVLAAAVALEHGLLALRRRGRPVYSTSGLSTGFSLAFMLMTVSFPVYLFALAVALGQKHLVQALGGRHFLNPSNAGIVAAAALFPGLTHIPVAEWGTELWFAGVVSGLGVLILLRVGLAWLPFVFLLSYGGSMWLLTTHNVGAIGVTLSQGVIMLFAFFFVTDPRAVPGFRAARFVYAVQTGLLAAALPLFYGPKPVTPFLALLLTELTVPLWRRLEARARPAVRGAVAAAALALVLAAALAVRGSGWSPLANLLRDFGVGTATSATEPGRSMDAAGEHGALSGGFAGAADAAAGVTAPAPRRRPAPDKAEVRALWGEPDPWLYPPAITADGIRSRPLSAQTQPTARRFADRTAAVDYPAGATAADLWYDTWPYGAAGVHDLNLDGRLDLVFAKVGRPLALLLNAGDGRFVHVEDHLFAGGPPAHVEQAGVADMNGDRYPDLVIVGSRYGRPTSSAVYLWDPDRFQYRFASPLTPPGRAASGGLALADLNGDGRLDIYVSYGLDYNSQDPDYRIHPAADQLYLSRGSEWRRIPVHEVFPGVLAETAYTGMTAAFVDVDRDGDLDLLLGNDFEDPSLVLLGGADGWELIDHRRIANNTVHSMSFFGADFDNDGELELWENGVSFLPSARRWVDTKAMPDGKQPPFAADLARLERAWYHGEFDCPGYRDPLARTLCEGLRQRELAVRTDRPDLCDDIPIRGLKAHCRRSSAAADRRRLPKAGDLRHDPENFPKQLMVNVLLDPDAGGTYANVLAGQEAAEYTGFTWGAYPFDVDNDGRLDVYVTNGALHESHDRNRLLVQTVAEGPPRFAERGADWGVDLEDDGRGAVIADVDGDGDGDLVTNAFAGPARYLRNDAGGPGLLVELRRGRGEPYGWGATIELLAGDRRQTRVLVHGGHWNASPPPVAHFGMEDWDESATLRVTWPDGYVQTVAAVAPGRRYLVMRGE